MRNSLLLILVLFAQFAYGQNVIETREASLMDGDYSLAGTVYLESFDDGTLDLRFDEDYLTQSNVFDVHVFLTNNNNYSTPIDTAGMLLVADIGTISGLNYSSGARTFDLPAGTGISDYEYIVFICVQYGQLHWGDGTFGEVVPTTTTVKEVDEKLAINLYPNPSENGRIEIQFQHPQQNILVEVLNLSGQLISSERIFGEQAHFIELKESGTYFLRLTSDDGSTVKKVIRL